MLRSVSWSLGAVALMLAAPSCKSSQSALPTWEGTNPEDGGDAIAAADASEPDPEAADSAEPEPAADAGGDAGAATEPPPADDPPPAAAASGGSAELVLPKPLHGKVNKQCGKDPGVGQRLKSFSLKTNKGKPISHKTYRGRVLVVNFWGTWCKPCLKELPEFDQVYRRYRKHGMTLLAIATDEEVDGVNEFVKKRRLAAKVAIGGEAYAGQYSASKFPFTFVVDTKGVIKSSYRGYKPECMGKLEADIRKELEKRAAAKAAKSAQVGSTKGRASP